MLLLPNGKQSRAFLYSHLLMASVKYLSVTAGASGRPVTRQVPWSLPLKVVSHYSSSVSMRGDRSGNSEPLAAQVTLWPMHLTSHHHKLLMVCSWKSVSSEKLGYNISTLDCLWIFSVFFIWIIQKEIKHNVGVIHMYTQLSKQNSII